MTDTTAELPRFVLLSGDDTISRQQALADVVAQARAQQPDTEVVRYSTDDQQISDFAEQILTPSLLTSLRVFIVSDADELDEKDYEHLTPLFGYDIPDACLILETAKMRSSKKTKDGALSKKYLALIDVFEDHAKKSPSKCIMLEFVKPPDYKMAEWVEALAPRLFKRRIAKKDAEYLIDLAGNDPSLLHSELQKIDLFLDDRAPITREVIDTVVGSTRLMAHYELAQAIAKKDTVRMLEVIESMYVGNVYLPPFVSAIFRQFWAMFRILMFAKSNPDTVRNFRASQKNFNRSLQEETGLAIGVAAGLMSEKQARSVYPVIVKSGIVDQALLFNEKDYAAIFTMLKEFDVGIKTGKVTDDKTGFQLFCFQIMRGAK